MELQAVLSPPDLDEAGYLGHLQGFSLGFHLYRDGTTLSCKEDRTNSKVPILTVTSPVVDVKVFRAFLRDCHATYIPRKGVRLAVCGLGGGCSGSKSKKDMAINPQFVATPAPSTQQPNPSSTPQPNPSSTQKPNPPSIPPEDPPSLPPTDPFEYSLRKRPDSKLQKRAFEIAEEVLLLAKKGVAIGMPLAELENIPMVFIQAPLPIAQRLLDALHQEAIWTLPTHYMVRYSIARLARKYMMDHLFLGRTAFFASTNKTLKDTVEEVVYLANSKDNKWPESGTLAQLSLIKSLITYTFDTTPWWDTLFKTAGTLFDVYSDNNPLLLLPLASKIYKGVSSLVGYKHLVESQLIIDNLYVAIRNKHPAAMDTLVDSFTVAKGWKQIYTLLALVEWGLQRRLLTAALLLPLREKLTELSQLSSPSYFGIKVRRWRICEKLASVLLLLGTQDDYYKQLLEAMRKLKQDALVQRVFDNFISMEACAEPPVNRVSNVTKASNFIGREVELEQAGRLLLEQKLVVLTGPAGIGKTMLGEFLANRQMSYSVVWKCEAQSVSAFHASIRSLSAEFNLPDFQLANVMDEIDSQRTLLILDDMSDTFPYLNDLKSKAAIIVTSRNSTLPNQVQLAGLEPAKAVKLMKELSGIETEQADMELLCQALTCHPLGLRNASALLRSNGSQSLKPLLDSLSNCSDEVEIAGKIYNGKVVEILKTCIAQAESRGVPLLLQILALLSSEGVPNDLYTAVFGGVEAEVLLQGARMTAEQYALVTSDEEGQLSMQKLMQSLALHLYPDYSPILHQAEKELFSQMDLKEWSPVQMRIYVSAEECLGHGEAVAAPESIKLSVMIANYQLELRESGPETRLLVTKCEEWMEQHQLRDISACRLLCSCLVSLGQVEVAEKWGNLAVQLAEKESTKQSIGLAACYTAMAKVYQAQGKLEAEQNMLGKARQVSPE